MQIIEAYQCLMDADRRKTYDQELKVQNLKYQLK
jgi:DnaJ-class molecular chaperone